MKTTKMFGFLDLYAMTSDSDVKRKWYTDHVHSRLILYRLVTAYLFQCLFENVMTDSNKET